MPKARRRKKVTVKGKTQSRAVNIGQSVAVSQNGHGDPALAMNAARVNRPARSPVVRSPQSLIFPTMVALGCWGIAFTFLFLSNDPNHTIFGVMAVLMALLWSFSLGVRVRKLLQQRS